MLPDAHTVHPVQPVPPHWLYKEAVQVEVAAADVLVVVLDTLDVVETVDVDSVEVDARVVVLDATDEDELLPVDPVHTMSV